MGQAPARKDCNTTGRGTPFVKTGEFGAIRPMIREWTTDPKRMACETDVLISVVGATCGKINLGADCAIGRSVAALRPRPQKLDQFWLHYFMEGQVKRLRTGSQGAAQTVISKDMLANTLIPLPPLEEQRRIVAVLDEAFEGLDRARAHAEANFKNAQDMLTSIIDNEFIGASANSAELELRNLCTNRGITYGVIKLGDHFPDGVPCLRTSNVRPLMFDLDGMKRITPELSQEYSRTILEGGELLVNVRGTLGGVAVVPKSMNGWNISREVAMGRCRC